MGIWLSKTAHSLNVWLPLHILNGNYQLCKLVSENVENSQSVRMSPHGRGQRWKWMHIPYIGWSATQPQKWQESLLMWFAFCVIMVEQHSYAEVSFHFKKIIHSSTTAWYHILQLWSAMSHVLIQCHGGKCLVSMETHSMMHTQGVEWTGWRIKATIIILTGVLIDD